MMQIDLELRDGESLMSDEDELVYRQITVHMMDGEQIATTAFGPMPSDNGMPSFSRSSLTNPQDARDWHTRNVPSPSLGVWALAVGEVLEAGRYTIDDSGAPLVPDNKRAPAHCFVDYRGMLRLERKTLRGRLWFRAIERGEMQTAALLGDGELFA
jgi:hypothetical protein